MRQSSGSEPAAARHPPGARLSPVSSRTTSPCRPVRALGFAPTAGRVAARHRHSGIPRATSVTSPHGRSPSQFEATDPGPDRLGVPSSDLIGCRRVGFAISDGQQRLGRARPGRRARSSERAQAVQGVPLVRGERAHGMRSGGATWDTPLGARGSSHRYTRSLTAVDPLADSNLITAVPVGP